MWNTWILLLVFHHSIPTTSIAEAVYEMHVDIFLIRKHVRYLDYDDIATQHADRFLVKLQQFHIPPLVLDLIAVVEQLSVYWIFML